MPCAATSNPRWRRVGGLCIHGNVLQTIVGLIPIAFYGEAIFDISSNKRLQRFALEIAYSPERDAYMGAIPRERWKHVR